MRSLALAGAVMLAACGSQPEPAEQPAAAADLYAQVLDEYPDDVEALTYRGWTTALSAADEVALPSALGGLARAVRHADHGDLGLAAVVGDPGDQCLLHGKVLHRSGDHRAGVGRV